MITIGVIAVMLLLVYRSIATMLLILFMVFLELGAARGVVALLAYNEIIGLSTFATSLLTLMVIAAGTDYAIFAVGRYQEARGAGDDREAAYYTMFHGTAHVILGSGLTIAGAMLCLSFTRLPYFQTMGVPCAVGTLVAVFAAMTLGPAVITIGSRFGRFEPKRSIRSRGWRRVGIAVVRWPGPVLAATLALALVGLLTLPGYKTNYDARDYLPADIPANVGYAVADQHFGCGADEPRAVDGRERSRSAQPGRLPRHRQDRQGDLPGARRRTRADDHPARRQADQAHHHPVRDEHAGHHAAAQREVHAGPDGRHAGSGRRDADDHRHDDEDVRV